MYNYSVTPSANIHLFLASIFVVTLPHIANIGWYVVHKNIVGPISSPIYKKYLKVSEKSFRAAVLDYTLLVSTF